MITDPKFTKAVSGFVQIYEENEIPSQISGDSLTFTLCNRTDTNSNLGNYFISTNLPSSEDELPKYQSLSLFYPELQQLNVDNIVLIKIPNTAYTEFIDGRSIELNVPVSGYSTSSLKLFSSTYAGAEYAQKYGETSPLLGDNIAYLFCDSINLPYTGLTVDEIGVIQDHKSINSWNPISRNYKERPSAVSYREVAQSNQSINTDRRYRINKSVYVDGLYQDLRGIALSTFDTVWVGNPAYVGFVTMPQNYFKVGDIVTLDEFNHNQNPTYSGNTSVVYIGNNFYQGGLKYAPKNYKGPFDVVILNIPWVNASSNEAGIIYESGGTYYNYDIPVGFVVLDKGLAVITHTDITSKIPWVSGITSSGSSNLTSSTTDIHFTGYSNTIYGDYEPISIMNFTALDTVFKLKATCNSLLGEFYISNNPTWYNRTVGDPFSDDDPVLITEVGLYNELNELVAVSKLSEPVSKGALDLLTFELEINL